MLKLYLFTIIILVSSCSSDQQEQGLESEELESGENSSNGNYQEEGNNQSNQYYDGENDSYSEYEDNQDSNNNLSNQDFDEALEGNYNQGENDQLFSEQYNQDGYNDNQTVQEESEVSSNDNVTEDAEIETVEEDTEEMPQISSIGDYNEFSGAPSVPGSLRVMAEGEAPEEYVVEYGDTLFDVCSQLLGEGGYWPKLWSLNNYIKNPHFIWPGMRLRFYPGDEEDPPFIEIVQDDEVVPVVDEEDVDINSLVQEVIMPTEETLEIKPTEVIGDIEEASDLIEVLGSPYEADKVSVTLPGFIFGEENPASCEVVGGTFGEAIVGEDRTFLCEPEEDLDVGSTYTAVRYIGLVEDADSGNRVGHQYQFVAHVKIAREIDGGDKYIGLVTKSRLGLTAGDIIVPYISTKRSLSLDTDLSNPAVADSTAHIVGFDLQGQQIGGQGSLVFLDKGTNDGVSNGQIMKIDQSLQYLLISYKLDEPTQDTITVGYVRIIDTTEVASIGYIIENNSEVYLGDYVGKG